MSKKEQSLMRIIMTVLFLLSNYFLLLIAVADGHFLVWKSQMPSMRKTYLVSYLPLLLFYGFARILRRSVALPLI